MLQLKLCNEVNEMNDTICPGGGCAPGAQVFHGAGAGVEGKLHCSAALLSDI